MMYTERYNDNVQNILCTKYYENIDKKDDNLNIYKECHSHRKYVMIECYSIAL